MATNVVTRTASFIAGAAIAQHLRVKLVSGKLAVAIGGGTDEPLEIGTMDREVFAADEAASVVLRNAPGTHLMVAAGVIAAGAPVYGTTGGQITATATANGTALGVAVDAAAAAGDVIEVVRF